jgi:2'-5' RNA ligase
MISNFNNFQLLLERSGSDLKFGCLMLFFDVSRYNFYSIVEKYIKKEDIYEWGIENEPHVTILYGLHDNTNSEDLKKWTIDAEDIKLKFGDISLFENEYDVLKIEVTSEQLTNINKDIRSNFDYTNKFKTYNAHITLSYLKKGTGKKYKIDKLKKEIVELLKGSTKYYIYSDKDSIKSLWV